MQETEKKIREAEDTKQASKEAKQIRRKKIALFLEDPVALGQGIDGGEREQNRRESEGTYRDG